MKYFINNIQRNVREARKYIYAMCNNPSQFFVQNTLHFLTLNGHSGVVFDAIKFYFFRYFLKNNSEVYKLLCK